MTLSTAAVVFAVFVTLVFTADNDERQVSGNIEAREKGHVVFYDDFCSGQIDSSKWVYTVSADGVGNNEFEMYTPESLNSYVKDSTLYLRPTLTVDRFGPDFLWNGTFDARSDTSTTTEAQSTSPSIQIFHMHCLGVPMHIIRTEVYGRCTNQYCVTKGWNQIHPVMSAMIHTTATIRYGRVEVVAQLPRGDWLWPAIWLMPRDNVYGSWPRSGEIDMMEARCNGQLYYQNGTSTGIDVEQSTLHYGPDTATQMMHHNVSRLTGSTFADDFHTYWLDWTQDYIKMGVDGETVLTDNTPPEGYWRAHGWPGDDIWAQGGKNAPFDQPFYVILNVAVGGNFFGDDLQNRPYPKPWRTQDPVQMMEFWNASHLWWPTWNGEDSALKVKSVTVVQY